MANLGVLAGVDADHFPRGTLRRDQAATCLVRLLDLLVQEGYSAG